MGYKKSLNLLPIEYPLQSYHRSNQDTTLVHKPLVNEGDWVQSGDLLSDCSTSVQGEFSIGHNILIAYLPWEGYNYEDAILISERLVYDDLYTSIHIERYDVSIEKTPFGNEQITKNIALLKDTNELNHLDKNGIAYLGSWLKEGDILVGKITPLESKKDVARYVQLYNEILGKNLDYSIRDTSLRMPRGLEAKVIKIQTFPSNSKINTVFSNITNEYRLNSFSEKIQNRLTKKKKFLAYKKNKFRWIQSFLKFKKLPKKSLKNFKFLNFFLAARKKSNGLKSKFLNFDVTPGNYVFRPNFTTLKIKWRNLRLNSSKFYGFSKYLVFSNFAFDSKFSKNIQFCLLVNSKKKINNVINLMQLSSNYLSKGVTLKNKSTVPLATKLNKKLKLKYKSKKLSSGITSVNIYLAEKRKVQVGDKMAGRHGNKGIISQILPRQDMPYLPDGTPIDMALNPLGVPSRMNVGQIYECLLGLAGKNLGEQYRIKPFDESFGPEASRSFVFSKLYEAKLKTGQSWIFQPSNPGKLKLYDGRTGNCFDQPMTSGYSYMIKLVHLVDDKLHSRSTGPYSLITQQPLKGRSKQGGQRLGEMEVWAIEAYGAAFTLLELLTIKSDDVTGRLTIWDYILYKKPLYIGTPASFKVMVCELQALCLDIGIYKADNSNVLKQINISTMG